MKKDTKISGEKDEKKEVSHEALSMDMDTSKPLHSTKNKIWGQISLQTNIDLDEEEILINEDIEECPTSAYFRQIKVKPSGCQVWNRQVVSSSSSGQHWGFAASRAIYIYSHIFSGPRLAKVIAPHAKTIKGFSWCPLNKNLIATCSLAGECSVWKVDTGTLVAKATLPSTAEPEGVQWGLDLPSPEEGDFDHPPLAVWAGIEVFSWKVHSGYSPSYVVTMHGAVSQVVFHPSLRGVLTVGGKDGLLILYDPETKKKKKLAPPSGSSLNEVVAMEYDSLSASYLLVSYGSGNLILWDTESLSVLQIFSALDTGICGLAWLDWEPGNFVTISPRHGILTLWNASNENELETLRVHNKGAQSIVHISGTTTLLISFVDGTLINYDMKLRQATFRHEGGHTETIFDCRFSPNSPHALATCSYDSTVKLWSLPEMSIRSSLDAKGGVLHSLTWHLSGQFLAASSSTGDLFVWDVVLCKLLHKIHLHRGSCMACDWNQLQEDLLITGGNDHKFQIVDPLAGSIVETITEKDEISSVHWSPFNWGTFALGSQGGYILIYCIKERKNDTLTITGPVKLQSHKKRVFTVVWSPLRPGVLATASDDFSIHVWMDIDLRAGSIGTAACVQQLQGHVNKVRPLCWSPIFEEILFSGSWDMSIKAWNVRTGTCLATLNAHIGDVYGITCHPQCPFLMISCSRDATLRAWTLEGMSSSVLLSLLLRSSNFQSQQGSRMDKLSLVQDLEKIFEALRVTNGVSELWSIVKTELKLHTKAHAPSSMQICHESSLLTLAEQDAKELEKIKIGSKKEDRLKQAAKLYLCSGNFKQYCETMVALGKWESALALAPLESLSYWAQLMTRCADQTECTQGLMAALPYHLATGSVTQAISNCQRSGENRCAKVIAKATEHGAFDPPDEVKLDRVVLDFEDEKESQHTPECMEDLPNGDDKFQTRSMENSYASSVASEAKDDCNECNLSYQNNNPTVTSLAKEDAHRYFKESEPVLAACAYLSVRQLKQAIDILLRSNEVELAYAVSMVLGLELQVPLRRIAERAEALGSFDLSLHALEMLEKSQHQASKNESKDSQAEVLQKIEWEKGMLCCRFSETREEADQNNAKAWRQSQRECGLELIYAQLMEGQWKTAAKTGLEFLTEKLKDNRTSFEEIQEMAWLLRSLRATELDEPIQKEFLAFMSYIGGLQAIQKGYTAVVGLLFENCASLITDASLSEFPISKTAMLIQEAKYLLTKGLLSECAKKLGLLQEDEASPVEIEEACGIKRVAERRMKQSIDEERKSEISIIEEAAQQISYDEFQIHTAGSTLPHNFSKENESQVLKTQHSLTHPRIVLEDGVTMIGLADASMWQQVNAFSPLNTGEWIKPF